MAIRVCVADGASVFRAGACEVLRREADFSVSEAADLSALRDRLAEGVDVLLIDAQLPPCGALAAISAARSQCPEIVVWSLRADSAQVFESVKAGATGYVRKEISPAGLVRSLRGAAHGESPLSRELTALMIDEIHTSESQVRARELTSVLSSRERQVLAHVIRGARNKQIAVALAISEFTVKRHVQNILRKLELPSRHAAAALYAPVAEAWAVGEREAS